MINNFKFKKNLGQNFLKNENIINKIIDKADINPNSLIIEIGPGGGALTKKLIKKSKYVLAYEIDQELNNILNVLKNKNNNLNIIFDNFLNRDLKEDIAGYKVDSIYIIANLPYYITTPIIQKIIDEQINIKQMILMVQKEVGERFSAQPGNKAYNSLTVFLNYYFNIKKLFIVNKNNFIPIPKVDSMVVSFSQKSKIKLINEALFFKIVKESFKYKRKTIKNNLKDYDLNRIEKVLIENNFNLNTRAEQIPLEVFGDIANELSI